MLELANFFIFASISIIGGAFVVLHPNPIKSVMSLVACMIGVSGLFFNLNAPFIGMVQLLVYAGAVIILFLFVVMIFDVETEGKNMLSFGMFSNTLKVLFLGGLTGHVFFNIIMKIDSFGFVPPDKLAPQYNVRIISEYLFRDYMFLFEVLGLLLLVIPIGTVALSRIRGGTHAE